MGFDEGYESMFLTREFAPASLLSPVILLHPTSKTRVSSPFTPNFVLRLIGMLILNSNFSIHWLLVFNLLSFLLFSVMGFSPDSNLR